MGNRNRKNTEQNVPTTTARIHLRSLLTLEASMDKFSRSSVLDPFMDSVRVNRGNVFERESVLVLFGDGGTSVGFEGDLMGVLGSSCSTDTMDNRRGLRFLGAS